MPWSHPSFENLDLPESYRSSEEPDWATLVPDRVPVAQRTASEALAAVLSCAGAWPRDVVSIRSVTETESRTGSWGARVPDDLMEGLVPTEPPEDQDGDGMPDAWERAAGLDPGDAADATTVQDSGYTAIEAYLHERAAALVPQGCPSGAETDPDPGTGSGSSSDGGDSGPLTSGGTDTPQASTGVVPMSSGTTDTDASTGPTADTTDGGGCSCRSQQPTPATWLVLWLFGLCIVRRRDSRAAEC